MQVSLHPSIVHFPLALTFVLPILVLVFAWMIRDNKMSPKAWGIILGLQILVTVSGYIALETGETDEDIVSKVVSKEFISEHEQVAEIFVGTTVIGLVVSIAAFFIRKEFQFLIKMVVLGIGLVSCFFGYRTGLLGGELVYKHGAASVFTSSEDPGVLPAEASSADSLQVMEENDSLKADDNDYGNSDEPAVDEDLKQED